MDRGTILLALLTYVAVAFFVLTMTRQFWHQARMPRSYPLTLFPAPQNRGRAASRLFLEVLTLRSLWSGSKEGWAAAWFFHASLAFTLIGHIAGIIALGLQFCLVGLSAVQSMAFSRLFGSLAGILLLLSLVYLLGRRLALSRLRLISRPEDYFLLVLLLAIVISGNWMRFFNEVDYAAVHDFLAGLLTFHPVAPPANPYFLIHYTLVLFLLFYFPTSKLVHSCGFFFTRWLIDAPDPRPAPGGTRLQPRGKSRDFWRRSYQGQVNYR